MSFDNKVSGWSSSDQFYREQSQFLDDLERKVDLHNKEQDSSLDRELQQFDTKLDQQQQLFESEIARRRLNSAKKSKYQQPLHDEKTLKTKVRTFSSKNYPVNDGDRDGRSKEIAQPKPKHVKKMKVEIPDIQDENIQNNKGFGSGFGADFGKGVRIKNSEWDSGEPDDSGEEFDDESCCSRIIDFFKCLKKGEEI